MLQMRVFVHESAVQEVGKLLQSVDGATRVMILGPTFDGSKSLITAELTPAMTDHVMRQLMDAGVRPDEIDVLQSDTVPTIEAGERSWLFPQGQALVWSAVVNQARMNARFSAKFAAFMGIAGLIAAFGVMTENPVLIVGAMALAPDLTPVTATSVGLVGRRLSLAARGLSTLVLGYAFTTGAALLTSAFMKSTGQLADAYVLPISSVQPMATYSLMILMLAFAAGVAGLLAFEERAGSAVGVAISVTTTPAAA